MEVKVEVEDWKGRRAATVPTHSRPTDPQAQAVSLSLSLPLSLSLFSSSHRPHPRPAPIPVQAPRLPVQVLRPHARPRVVRDGGFVEGGRWDAAAARGQGLGGLVGAGHGVVATKEREEEAESEWRMERGGGG